MAYRAFFLSCFLLLFCAEVYGADIPALQEWYHINSTMEFTVFGPMSYIPNFDTANGGYHATSMGVIRKDGSYGNVWYHRYYFDTVGQYTWKWASNNITQVDLDGNGVLDYLSFGRIIRGTKNGSPPEDTLTAYYNWLGTPGKYTVVDLNNDGINDVLANLNSSFASRLFSVLVGGPDLKQLKYTLVSRTLQYNILNAEYFLGLLKAKAPDSSFRIVTLPYDRDSAKWCSLVLKRMTTEMFGDSLVISLQTLDSISFNTAQTREWIVESASSLYRSSLGNKEYLFASVHNLQENARYTVVYDCAGDILAEVMRFRSDNRSMYALNADINGDGYWDWAMRSGEVLYLYAGQREGIDTIPLGKYQLPCGDGITHIYAIGDVNNDGIRDMAVALQPYSGVDGCFSIILGAPLGTVDIPEVVAGYKSHTFDIQQNYPNPIGADRTTTVPISTEMVQYMQLDLYSLQGRFIGTLFDGQLPAGSHTLSLDLSSYHLPRGMYLLRLSGKDDTRERAILID